MTELQELLDAVNGEIYGVWFLIGAALVFWMQAGFAMVEVGDGGEVGQFLHGMDYYAGKVGKTEKKKKKIGN